MLDVRLCAVRVSEAGAGEGKAVSAAGGRMGVRSRRQTARPLMKVDLRCTCGGALKGQVSPSTAVMKIRDVYMSFHRGDEHAITDSSEDIA